ncbi:MAG: hypothetical protein QXJ51_01305 [Sulfolobales archaeon]
MQGVYEILIIVGLTILIAVVGYVAGFLSRMAVRAFLEKLGFDEWFRKFAIGRAMIRGGYTPSEFFGVVTSWIIYISSILIAVYYLSSNLNIAEVSTLSYQILTVYVAGFVKTFIIIVIGFLLVDAFINYLYKSSELRSSDERILTSIAEYLRILLYIVALVFALEVGGINVGVLRDMLTPLMWGLTIVMIILITGYILERVLKK